MNEQNSEPVTITIEIESIIEEKARQLAKESNLSLSEFFSKIIAEKSVGSGGS